MLPGRGRAVVAGVHEGVRVDRLGESGEALVVEEVLDAGEERARAQLEERSAGFEDGA